MENETYKEWQTAWTKERDSENTVPLADFIDWLNHHEKHTRRINRVKGLSVALIFITLFLHLLLSRGIAWDYSLIGLLLVLINTVLFMVSLFRKQFSMSKLDLGQSSLDFIRQAIVAIQAEMRHVKRYFFPFLLLQAVAVNIWFIQFWLETSLPKLLILHIGTTLFLFIAAGIGLRARYRRYTRKTEPLVRELQETERSWSRSPK